MYSDLWRLVAIPRGDYTFGHCALFGSRFAKQISEQLFAPRAYLSIHLYDDQRRYGRRHHEPNSEQYIHVGMQRITLVQHAYDAVGHVAEQKEQKNGEKHFAYFGFALKMRSARGERGLAGSGLHGLHYTFVPGFSREKRCTSSSCSRGG